MAIKMSRRLSIIPALIALLLLTAALSVHAQDGTQDLIKKADSLYKAGKYREAIDAYKAVLEQDPYNDHALGYIAYSFNKLSDSKSAREWMKRRVELPNQSPSTKAMVLTDMTLLYWDESDMKIKRAGRASDKLDSKEVAAIQKLVAEGIEHAQKALAIAPRSAKAFNLLNLLYRASASLESQSQKEAVEKADEALRRAVQIVEQWPQHQQPNDIFAWPTVSTSDGLDPGSNVHVGQPVKIARPDGFNDKSEVVTVEVFVGVDGRVRMPRLVSGQGKAGQAAVEAARKYEFEPTTFEGRPVQLIALISFPDKRVQTTKSEAPAGRDDREPLSDEVADLLERGDQLARTAQYDEAAQQYSLALAKAGKPLFAAYLRLGNVHFEKKDYQPAVDAYRQAIALRPRDHRAHYNLAEALYGAGNYGDAEAEYRKAIELNPGRADPRMRHFLGLALFQQKRVDEAIAEYRIAITQASGFYAEAHYNLGVALLARKEYASAERAFRLAIEQEKKPFADAHFNLAIVLEKQGRAREAADQYEVYLRLNPDAADTQRVRALIQHLRRKSA